MWVRMQGLAWCIADSRNFYSSVHFTFLTADSFSHCPEGLRATQLTLLQPFYFISLLVFPTVISKKKKKRKKAREEMFSFFSTPVSCFAVHKIHFIHISPLIPRLRALLISTWRCRTHHFLLPRFDHSFLEKSVFLIDRLHYFSWQTCNTSLLLFVPIVVWQNIYAERSVFAV